MSNIIKLDPLTRVEGDLAFEAKYDSDNRVIDAKAIGTLYRGFEQFLIGKKPNDALGITPRICGLCSSSHSYVCANALRNLFKATMPPNGYHIKNIVLAIENIQNHLTHVYLFFAPDLAHHRYKSQTYYSEIVNRFQIGGSSYKKYLNDRNDFMNLMGIFGGRWPHNLAMQPGGTSENLEDKLRINYGFNFYLAFREKIEEQLLNCGLDEWLKKTTITELHHYLETETSDLSLLLNAGREFALDKIGKGPETYIAGGAYDLINGDQLFKSGFYDGETKVFSHNHLHEFVKYSYFYDDSGGHPFKSQTTPMDSEDQEKYTWIKAGRYLEQPVEVGPLARMIVDGDPLISALFAQKGASVWLRVFARIQEALKTLQVLGDWIKQIDVGGPNINHWKAVENGEGVGLGAAARGLLGHWIKVADGLITNYQIITPTAINASPRDHHNVPGPLESAVIGTQLIDPNDPLEIYHIIRSYDPCMVCSCHAIQANEK